LSELGFIVEVSHRISDSGSVTNTIIRKVYESDLVIANLTGNNPNVMYEVALRHASAKPIIHITENIRELPFDISDQRTIPYVDDIAGAYQLKKELQEMLNGIDYLKPAINPITLALKNTNLINIPEGMSKDFNETLLELVDNVKQIRATVMLPRDTKETERPILVEWKQKPYGEEMAKLAGERILQYYITQFDEEKRKGKDKDKGKET